MTDATGSHHDELDAIIGDYLQAVDAGQVPSRDALLAEHPQHADALRRFFADYDQLDNRAEALKLARPTEAPARPMVRYFGDYELLEELARGGMGIVYKARQASLNRLVALKMIVRGQLATSHDVARFRAEAEAAANLDHQNIVPIYEVGEYDGQQYYAMRFIDGSPLNRRPRGDARSEAQLVATIAHAVHFAHLRGLIHRDIKPSNILVDQAGVPNVADFGLAKRLSGSGADLTVSGELIGTPRYMAPEQAGGRKDLTVAVDVYSLGVVLYERLTGRTPFTGDTVLDILRQAREHEPPRPSSIIPGLPRDLETICLKCLDKAPDKRYATADAVAEDLERWLRGEPIVARPVGQWGRVTRWCKRNPAVAGLIAATLALLLVAAFGGIGFAIYQQRVANTERTLRQDVQKALDESKNTLVRHHVANGLRLVEERDLFGSLVWFARALELDHGDVSREHAHRVRLAAVLRQCPKLVQLWAFEGSVQQAEFSPDERTVLTVSGTDVTLWDRRTGEGAFPPLKHMNAVKRAAFSPDGKLIVTACEDGAARVWETSSGRMIGAELRHDAPVNGAAFSPDSAFLVTTSDDKTARRWSVESGKQVGPACMHDGPVTAPSFAPDGRRFLTTSEGFNVCTAWVWDAATNILVTRSPAHQDDGSIGAAFSPDGKRVLSFYSSDIKAAWIWDGGTGKETTPRLAPGQDIVDASFSPDGKWVVTASGNWVDRGSDAKVRVWNAATGQPLDFTIKRSDPYTAVRFSPDGGQIVTGGQDGIARVWDAKSGEPNGPPLWHRGRVTDLRFSANGRFLLTASGDGTARLWDLASDEAEAPILVQSEYGFDQARSPDGQRVAIGGWDGTVRVADASTDETILFNHAHKQTVEQVRFSADGRMLVTASRDKTARVWDVHSGRPLTPPLTHRMGVFDARFSPDGRRVATHSAPWRPSATSGGDAGEVRVWDVATGQPVTPPLPLAYTGYDLKFSRDSRLVAACCSYRNKAKSEIDIWETETGKLVRNFKADAAYEALALSPDCDRIAACSQSEQAGSPDEAVIWDIGTGNELHRLKHDGGITSVEFSRDGRQLLTASRDRTARVWNVETGQPAQAPMVHARGLAWATFGTGDRHIVTVDSGPNYQAWDAATSLSLTPPIGRMFNVVIVDPGHWINRLSLSYHEAPILNLAADSRHLHDWVELAGLLAGRKLDERGVLAPLGAGEAQVYWRNRRADRSAAAESVQSRRIWHRHEGIRFADEGNWDAAAWHFERLVTAIVTAREVDRLALATCCARADRNDRALELFSSVLESRPNDRLVVKARGDTYAKLRRWSEAAADLNRCMDADCLDLGEYAHCALVQVLAGDVAAYQGTCERMVAAFQGLDKDEVPYNGLAWTCIYGPSALKEPAKLVALAEEAVKEDGRKHTYLNTLGAALYRAGRFADSLKVFEEGISDHGTGGTVEDWVFLAMVHHRLGDAQRAQKYLKDVAVWLGKPAAEPKREEDRLLLEALYAEAKAVIASVK